MISPEGEAWLLTDRIPLTLIDSYLNKGHTLTTDNMYTTTKLVKHLLQKFTKVLGTIQQKRNDFSHKVFIQIQVCKREQLHLNKIRIPFW